MMVVQCLCGFDLSSRVGALADIRRYLRNYYLIMDVSLSDKVSVAVTSQAGACIDGESPPNIRQT